MTINIPESMKMDTDELSEVLCQYHGNAFNPIMYDAKHYEGVLAFGPNGVDTTKSVQDSAQRMANSNGMELVSYTPGVRQDPSKKQCLFVHITSHSVEGLKREGVAYGRVIGADRIDDMLSTAMEFYSAIYFIEGIDQTVCSEAMLKLISKSFDAGYRRELFILTVPENDYDTNLNQKLSTAFRNQFSSYYVKGEPAITQKTIQTESPVNNILRGVGLLEEGASVPSERTPVAPTIVPLAPVVDSKDDSFSL